MVALIAGVALASCAGGSTASTTTTSTTSSTGATGSRPARSAGPDSIEAGVEPWQMSSPLSRESVVANGAGLTVLGGITPSGSSLSTVSTLNPSTGATAPAGALADPVHDAAASAVGGKTFDFGGGSPDTVATVQSITTPSIPPGSAATGAVAGQLPAPRSDLAVATVPGPGGGRAGTRTYIVGGYDGTNYLPGVLGTDDGTHFTPVASLPVPVRYPAVATISGKLFAFGGETRSPAAATATTTATDDIQMVDPASGQTRVVGHLPQALYGASAFVIGGTAYVAGGQAPGGATLTTIDAFVPSTGKVLAAGLLPQADAFAGYATIGSGKGAIGYMVGGEVASQTG
ncbi:MAG: hypothetical protein ACRDYE_03070, partial [Acidimicrobiales bacterium]